MKKGLITDLLSTVSAVLLAVWYLLSVAGLDVHHDHEHGRTYVVSGICGGDCEAIHPHVHCHDADDEGACLTDEECCTDDFAAVLAVGGAQDAPAVPLAAPSGLALLSPAPACLLPQRFLIPVRMLSPPPGGGVLLSRICVLRV